MMAWYDTGPQLLGVLLLLPLLGLALLTTVGASALARGPQRQVPRHPLRRAVPRADLALRHPRGLRDDLVAAPWRTLYGINPMAAVVEGFRWALAGGAAPETGQVALSVVAGLALFASGYLYFNRTERDFADVI